MQMIARPKAQTIAVSPYPEEFWANIAEIAESTEVQSIAFKLSGLGQTDDIRANLLDFLDLLTTLFQDAFNDPVAFDEDDAAAVMGIAYNLLSLSEERHRQAFACLRTLHRKLEKRERDYQARRKAYNAEHPEEAI